MNDRSPIARVCSRFNLTALLVGGLFLFLLGAWYFRGEILTSFPLVRDWVGVLMREVRTWPMLWFFAALVIAPLVGLPAAPLFVALGLRLPLFMAIPLAVLSIALNLLLSFQLGRTLLRPSLLKILGRLGHTLPDIAPANRLGMTLLFRITPGMPVFAGNYLLPMAGVPFRIYFPISLAIQSAFAAGFVVLGQSLFSGTIGLFITACCLIAALSLVARLMYRRRLTRLSDGDGEPSGHN